MKNIQLHKTNLIKGNKYDVTTLTCTGWTEGDGSGHDGYNVSDYFAADGTYRGADADGIEPLFEDAGNIQLHTELTQWNDGDLGKTAPSQLDDPNNVLVDARAYEEGAYECSDETAKARSQSAIDAYCRTEEAAQY